MDYYVCDYHTHQVLRGPWTSAQVVEFINTSKDPKKFCNMSRYLLAKEGVYPNNSAGNELIAYHLAQSNTGLQSDVALCLCELSNLQNGVCTKCGLPWFPPRR